MARLVTTRNPAATASSSRRLASLLVGLACLSAALPDDPPRQPGAAYPLPAALVPHFAETSYATTFVITGPEGAEAHVYAWFSLQATGGLVQLRSIHHGPTSPGLVRRDDFSTSFQPTALCKRSGETDTLYVAGWFPSRRMAVIEEWTLEPLALGESFDPAGEPVASMSAPRFTRRLLVLTSGADARPIESLACDPFADELLVLEDGPDARLTRVRLGLPAEEMTLEPVADVSTLPQLADVRSMRTGFHEDRGLTLVLKTARAWKIAPKQTVMVIYDANGDGRIDDDTISEFTPADWIARFPDAGWVEHW